MAEFGPKVFHALGMYADRNRNNSFLTGAAKDVGLLEGEDTNAEMTADEQIEQVKNALFKVMMLRLRDSMQELGKDRTNANIGPDNIGVPVTMTVYFNDSAIHPEEKDSDKGLKEVEYFKMRVRGISVLPDIFDAEDTKMAIGSFHNLAMACGSYPRLNEALSLKYDDDGNPTEYTDPIFSKLWGE